MGAEVLPTASPQATDFMTPPPVSPTPPTEPVSSPSILDDEFEEQAPPRKISSSEALRALSKATLDSGTVWTVVNPNRDEIIVEQEEMASSSWNEQPDESGSFLPAVPDPPMLSRGSEPPRTSRKLGSVSEKPEDVDNDDDSSDDEFLSMAKPKSFTDNGPLEDYDAEEDDMFHFEAGGLSAPPRPRPIPLPVKADEEVEEDLGDVPEIKPSLYATSPAVHIARPSSLSAPTTPTMAKFQAGSLGSYKGRRVIMPEVRNPDVHAQAASLGQFNTFVGGLDGRSGMDEGDLNSFRASVSNMAFSGTPRSFTERLLMELKVLERGIVDINTRDDEIQTLLFRATEKGHDEIVRVLVEKGADLETKNTIFGKTPLSYAAENGHEAVIKLLLEKGANIESKDSYGRMLLSYAAENGHEAVIKLLLEKGANIESKDSYGRMPLSYAAENGHEAVVKLLLEKGANIESKSSYGQTPLSYAAEKGHEAVVKLLLEKGANIESKDSDGRTPLLYAAEKGHEAVVKLLQSYKGQSSSTTLP